MCFYVNKSYIAKLDRAGGKKEQEGEKGRREEKKWQCLDGVVVVIIVVVDDYEDSLEISMCVLNIKEPELCS